MSHADDLLRAALIVGQGAEGNPDELALASRLRAAAETHVLVPREPTVNLPEMKLADDFGDPETLLNSRDWLTKAVKAQGAQVTGGGCGCGQADIDIKLEGFDFNVSIKPIIRNRGQG